MQQPDVLQAKRVLVVQFALTLVLTAAALPVSLSVAVSVLIGAAVCVLANSIFAFWVFRRYRAQEPEALLLRLYGAEVIKLFLALGLFAIVFAAGEGLNLPVLLGAYVAVQVLSAVVAFQWHAPKTRER